VNYGQLTLKRGMTNNFDLWDWLTPSSTAAPHNYGAICAANVDVVMLAADHKKSSYASFPKKCLLTKLKPPSER